MTRPFLGLVSALVILFVPSVAISQEIDYVAGLEPHQRPGQAPVKSQYDKDAQWYCRALIGISRPYPPSLRFLEDQGGWHTPFVVAGMTGPYDIRNWHRSTECR